MKIYRLVQNLFGDRYSEFTHVDIDRNVRADVFDKLATATSTPIEELHDASLIGLSSLLNGIEPASGHIPWIVPFGANPRKHQQTSIQFCPMCLKTDARPYFRRAWRLAYYTECDLHDVLMEGNCPHCLDPVNYFHIDTSDLRHPFSQSLDICHKCGGRLSQATPKRDYWPDYSHTLAIKAITLPQGLDWRFIGDRVFNPTSSLMLVLRMLIAAMCSRDPRGALYDHVAQRIWPEGYRTLTLRGVPFEFRPVEERRRLFGMAVWLMMDWPNRLQDACFDLQLSDGQLTMYARNMPHWFYFERTAYVASWYRTGRRFKLK